MAYNTKGTATPWYRQPAFLGGLGHAGAGLLAAGQPGPVGQRPSIMARTMAGLPGAMQAAGATEMQRRLYEQQVAAGERAAALAPLQTQALKQGIATRDRAAEEAERVRRQREGLRELYGGYGGPTTTDLGTRGPAATLARIGELAPEAVMEAQLREWTRAPTTPKPQAVMDWTDPKNPTPRIVSAQEAISNRNYRPFPSGLKMRSDGKGGFELATGTATLGDLAKPTKGVVEKKVLSTSDTLNLLNRAQSQYQPKFHQLGPRWSAMKTAWQEKAGGLLGQPSREDMQTLFEYSQYRATTGANFTAILKDLSGVAVNPTEYKRAEIFIPHTGTGLFDGDSPSQVEAKRQNMIEFTRNALRKYNYVRRRGLDWTDDDRDYIAEMPQIFQKRGEELFIKYTGQGLSDDAAKAKVRKTLLEEFGV